MRSVQQGWSSPSGASADRLSFAEIEQYYPDFGKRCLANKLDLPPRRRQTFTITNGGIFGSLLSTPIVNPPKGGVLRHARYSRSTRRIMAEKKVLDPPHDVRRTGPTTIASLMAAKR